MLQAADGHTNRQLACIGHLLASSVARVGPLQLNKPYHWLLVLQIRSVLEKADVKIHACLQMCISTHIHDNIDARERFSTWTRVDPNHP